MGKWLHGESSHWLLVELGPHGTLLIGWTKRTQAVITLAHVANPPSAIRFHPLADQIKDLLGGPGFVVYFCSP